MAAPGRKFSFMRLINNAIPNMAFDSKDDVDLSPAQADNLVKYQLALPFPRYLDEKSVFVAGITENMRYSEKVYKTLVRQKLIRAAPMPGTNDDDDWTIATVNTSGVDRNFANKFAIISVHAQRKLIGLLFFWEEECTRWRMLQEEEKEILQALDTEGCDMESLNVAYRSVEIKKRLLPSQRAEHTANVCAGASEHLPAYSSAS